MNILIIGTTDILGGAAKISWDIKTALEKTGRTVSMFVADKRSNDLNVHIIPRQTLRKYINFLFATEKYTSSDWIMKTEEFKKADIIHCHNLHGRFFNLQTLQKMSEIKPVIWTLHDEWAITPHCAYTLEGTKIANGLYICPNIDTQPRILWDNTRKLIEWKNNIYKNSRLHIITPSEWLKKRVMNSSLSNQEIQQIPNGIDTSTFTQTNKQTAREKLGLPQDKKIVLFLANDAKNNTWKGWKYTQKIIDTYNSQSNILFLNVGNLVKHENEKNIRYIGEIKLKSDLALYYSAADVLLFTSIAENFPLVILEAMSCGLPIITFDVGGVKEVIAHKINGFVAKYLDINDLLNGMNWFFNLSKSEIEMVSKNSSEKIRSCYDTSIMTNAYLELYKNLL